MKTITALFIALLVLAIPAQASTETRDVRFWSFSFAESGYAEGVSENGIVAGSGPGVAGYFLWTEADGITAIGGTPAGDGVGGQAKISNDGLFVCGTTYNVAMGYNEMSRYDVAAGTWTGFGAIPDIGFQVDAEISSGWGMSGDGQSVVGLGWTSLGTVDAHAFQWTEGVGTVDLGSAAVGFSSRASATDLDGNVVGGWQDGNGRQGAVWVDGVQELIFTDTGDIGQEVFAVSDDGVYATGIGYGGFIDPGYAFRYNIETNVYEPLPQIPVGAESNMAGAGITADGKTIVGGTWSFGPATWGRGLIWREGIGTVPFSDYLDELGISYPDGYIFNFVSDISPDGRWITGWGGMSPVGADGNFVIHVPDVTFQPAITCFATELVLPHVAAFQVDITNSTADPIAVSGGVYVTLCNGNEFGPFRTGVMNLAGFASGEMMWSQPIPALNTTCDCDLVFTVKAQDDAVGYQMTGTCTMTTTCP